MATEEKEGGDAPKKGGGSKLIIIMVVIFVLLIALAVGGLIAYQKLAPSLGLEPLFGAGGSATEKKEPEKVPEIEESTMFPLPSFIVNLADVGGNRFIKVTFQLELNNVRLEEEITKRLPQIQDQIITVLSGKTMESVTDADGKFKLKSEIMRRLNQFLLTGAVSNIYYTEFVVQ